MIDRRQAIEADERMALTLLRGEGCDCAPTITVQHAADAELEYTHKHDAGCAFASRIGLLPGDTATGRLTVS